MEPNVVSRPSPRPWIRLIGVPPAHYLALAGKGPLEAAGIAAQAVLRVGEAIRARHAAAGRSFALAFPELLAWDDGSWEVLLRVPEVVRPAEIAAVRKAFHARQRQVSRGVVLLRLEEGACLEGTLQGHSAAAISAALQGRARELGMDVAQPRHEMRRPGGPLVVRHRLLMKNGIPPVERPRRLGTRPRRSRGLPASWKRRL